MNGSVPAGAAGRGCSERTSAIPMRAWPTLTWGNVSGVDRDRGVYVIKPSGVPYDRLAAEHLVVVKLASGRIVDGDLKPFGGQRDRSSALHGLLLHRGHHAHAFHLRGGVAQAGGTSRCWARRMPTLSTGPCRCAPDLDRGPVCRPVRVRSTGQVMVDPSRPSATIPWKFPVRWWQTTGRSSGVVRLPNRLKNAIDLWSRCPDGPAHARPEPAATAPTPSAGPALHRKHGPARTTGTGCRLRSSARGDRCTHKPGTGVR